MKQKLSIIIGVILLLALPISLTGSQKASNDSYLNSTSVNKDNSSNKRHHLSKARKQIRKYRKDQKAEFKNNPRRNAEEAKIFGILSLVFLIIFMPASIVLGIIAINKANRASDFRLYQEYEEAEKADILYDADQARLFAKIALIISGVAIFLTLSLLIVSLFLVF